MSRVGSEWKRWLRMRAWLNAWRRMTESQPQRRKEWQRVEESQRATDETGLADRLTRDGASLPSARPARSAFDPLR